MKIQFMGGAHIFYGYCPIEAGPNFARLWANTNTKQRDSMKKILGILAGACLLAGCASDDDYSYSTTVEQPATPTGVDDPGDRSSESSVDPAVETPPPSTAPDSPSEGNNETPIPEQPEDNSPGDSGDEPLKDQ